MAAPEKYIYMAGLNYGQILKLRTDGLPDATGTTAYEGFTIPAPTTLAPTKASPSTIPWNGNDTKRSQIQMPGTDPTTFVLTCSRRDDDLHAAVTNTKVQVLHEANVTLDGDNDQNGNEPSFAITVSSRAKTGSQTLAWATQVYRNCTMIPQLIGANSREGASVVYDGQADRFEKLLTGNMLSTANNGATFEAVHRYTTNKRIWWAFFLADGTEDEFLFHTDRPANDITSMGVYEIATVGGSAIERTTNLTKTTTKITFSTTIPASGALIAVQYQLADSAIAYW